MIKTPKISIIVPVYNVEIYLRECFDSIVNQTFKDFEVICINDGSTDNSLQILEEYAAKDSRFIILSQENQGQGVARNKGIEISKGKYISFVDPDEWMDNGALETLYNFAEEKSAQIVRFDYKSYEDYTGKGKETSLSEIVKKEFNYDLKDRSAYNWRIFKDGCMRKLGLAVWAYFYNKQFILENNIKFAPSRRGEDHLFSVGAILCANEIYYLKQNLYYYRTRLGSAVNSVGEDNFLVFDNIQRMKEFLLSHSLYQELEEEFLNYSQTCLEWHYDQTPKKMIKRYEDLCKQYFKTNKEFKKWLKKTKTRRNLIENIFSLKNQKIEGVKHKAVTILGYTFLIKPKQQRGKV